MKHIFITLGYKIVWNLIKSWSLIWNTHKVICHWKKRGEGAASGTFTQWGIWFVHFMFLLCCLKNFFKIYSNVILCNHWSSVDWVSPESRCRIYVNNLQLIPSAANAKNGHSKWDWTFLQRPLLIHELNSVPEGARPGRPALYPDSGKRVGGGPAPWLCHYRYRKVIKSTLSPLLLPLVGLGLHR